MNAPCKLCAITLKASAEYFFYYWQILQKAFGKIKKRQKSFFSSVIIINWKVRTHKKAYEKFIKTG